MPNNVTLEKRLPKAALTKLKSLANTGSGYILLVKDVDGVFKVWELAPVSRLTGIVWDGSGVVQVQSPDDTQRIVEVGLNVISKQLGSTRALWDPGLKDDVYTSGAPSHL
jgi:hypothetical protein